jgi:hypothetical protein
VASGQFPVPETRHQMIIHHSDCLHVCVANRRTNKFESTTKQVLAQGVGNIGPRGDFPHAFAVIDDGLALDKSPKITVETAEFIPHFQKRPGILNRWCYF